MDLWCERALLWFFLNAGLCYIAVLCQCPETDRAFIDRSLDRIGNLITDKVRA